LNFDQDWQDAFPPNGRSLRSATNVPEIERPGTLAVAQSTNFVTWLMGQPLNAMEIGNLVAQAPNRKGNVLPAYRPGGTMDGRG